MFLVPLFGNLLLCSIHKVQAILLAGAEVYHAQVAAHQRAAVPQPRIIQMLMYGMQNL